MTALGHRSAIIATASISLMLGTSISAFAQSALTNRSLTSNDAIFIDGRTFTVTQGSPKGDVAAQIRRLGAQELGAGAIIFRSDDKLYVVDAARLLQKSAAAYALAIERPRSQGLRDEAAGRNLRDEATERNLRDEATERNLRDEATERNLRDEATERNLRDEAVERNLRNSEIARQAQGSNLRDSEIARQAQGSNLRDSEIARQAQGSHLRDSEIARQAQGSHLRDSEIARQAQGSHLREGANARDGVYINDPDYAYYKLKKTFGDIWNATDKM